MHKALNRAIRGFFVEFSERQNLLPGSQNKVVEKKNYLARLKNIRVRWKI